MIPYELLELNKIFGDKTVNLHIDRCINMLPDIDISGCTVSEGLDILKHIDSGETLYKLDVLKYDSSNGIVFITMSV